MIWLGPNLLDVAAGVVLTPDGQTSLSEKERVLVQRLWRDVGHPVPKSVLEGLLWPEGLPAGSRALDLLFSRLRAKVEPPRSRGRFLQSIRGQGYALLPPPPQQHPAHRRGSLVGRARELALALAWARQPAGRRWLTVTGLGGMGKTRIAQAVADTLTDEGETVRWVDLSPLRDGDAPLLAVAAALGLEVRNVDDLARSLRVLREPVLLVADNLEHVPRAAGRLSDLVQLAPKLRVLATSRRVVRAKNDQVLRLEGIGAEAGDLFRERLAAVVPELVGAIADSVVHEICESVHGMPLSIELAVATLRFQPPERLLATLRASPHTLHGEKRGRPERQTSLEATFAYSLALLDPSAQRGLAALSLFAGRFGEVEASALGVDAALVDGLVAHALVRDVDPAPRGTSYASGRALHPLVRSFATDRRRSFDPDGDLELRYRRWFLGWAGEQAARVATDLDPELSEAWSRYLPDLDSAWNMALQADDGDALAAGWSGIAARLHAGHPFPESAGWRESALRRLANLPHRRALRHDVLAAHAHRCTGREADAAVSVAVERALAEDPSPIHRVHLLRAAGRLAGRRADADAGVHALDAALAQAEAVGDPVLIGQVHLDRSERFVDLGRSDLGWDDARAAAAAFDTAGHPPLLRRALLRQAAVFGTRQDPATDALLDQLAALCKSAGDEPTLRLVQDQRVRQLRKAGQLAEALPLTQELLDYFGRTGQAERMTSISYFRGSLLLDLGRLAEAETELMAAIELARVLGAPKSVGTALHALSTAQLAAGRHDAALATLDALQATVDQHFPDDAYWQALCGGNYAYARWLSGDSPGARTAAGRAEALCADLPPSMRFAIALIDGILLAEQGSRAAAAEAGLRALQIAAPTGPWMVQRALIHVGTILASCGHEQTAAALLPQLRAAEPTPEKWIYLPPYERRLAGVTLHTPPLSTQDEALRAVLAALEALARRDRG